MRTTATKTALVFGTLIAIAYPDVGVQAQGEATGDNLSKYDHLTLKAGPTSAAIEWNAKW